MNAFTKLLCCLFLFSAYNPSFAASNTTDVDLPQRIILRADEQLGIIYTHQLKKNQTIFGLSKFFNTDLDMISAANPAVDLGTVKLNQRINIPINTAMITSERNLSPTKSYIPVFYTVKAKDNLFRISKVYFHQSIENVMNINNLKTMDLSIGQKILVGWYQYDERYKERLAWKEKGIEVAATGQATTTFTAQEVRSYQTEDAQKDISNVRNNDAPIFQKKLRSLPTNHKKDQNEYVDAEKPIASVEESKEKVYTETKVKEPTEKLLEDNKEASEETTKVLSSDPFENRNNIFQGSYIGKPKIHDAKIRAEWNMSSKDKVNLFALHATAKVNSYIEIYNPMLNRKVIAKVVGNLPPKAHKKNVDLIISPKVAETLGAVDKRFYVQVRFIE